MRHYVTTPGTTTLVTADHKGENEIDRICTYPPNAIMVDREHICEMVQLREERRSRASTNDGLQSGQTASGSGSSGSTDDFLRKSKLGWVSVEVIIAIKAFPNLF